MVRRQDLNAKTRRSFRENMAGLRTNCSAIRRPHCPGESEHQDVHAGGAFVRHDLRAQTSASGTTTDGVNDPVSTAWGSLAGQDSGVVHAIAGSATATPTPTVTAAQSAASMACSQQGAAVQTLA
jgi:hypothetical protein